MNEQTDLIKATPLAKIQNLIDLIDRARPRQSATLLIRIGRFLGERLRSGELEAGPLEEEIHRLLTSLSFLLEQLLNPEKEEAALPDDLFIFDPSPPAGLLEQALSELKGLFIKDYLWSPHR